MRITAAFLLSAAAGLAPLTALAQNSPLEATPAQDARAVAQLWRNHSRDTVFDRWVADQLMFYARDCARQANISPDPDLQKAQPSGAGTWRSPSNDAEGQTACQTLAKAPLLGRTPVCAELNSQQPPFASPRGGLPRNYAFLARGIRSGERVTVGGYCWLAEGEASTKQFFAGPAVVQVLNEPTMTQVQTAQGPRMLKTSSVSFDVQGYLKPLPPLLAIWP